MRKQFFLGVLLVLFGFSVQGGEACPVHEANQKIFSEVMKTHIAQSEELLSIFGGIDVIGQEALQRGMDLSCYTYTMDPESGELFYHAYPLWEGKERAELVALLFVWPSEQEALKHSPESKNYKTVIHSHPIPCAYTVMQNAITENRYVEIEKGVVAFSEKEVLGLGDKAVDLDQDDVFIHQLLYEGRGKQPAITLHIYGSPSVEELITTLTKDDEHIYAEPS